MNRSTFYAILLTLIALISKPQFTQAQMTMDAAWTVIPCGGTTLKLELGIRTNTASENLGPAIFTFTYNNNTYVSYSTYIWKPGFGPTVGLAVTAYNGTNTGVTESPAGTINIDLDYSSGIGTAISSTSSYTPIVDIIFSVSDSTKTTDIAWNMTYDPTFLYPNFAYVDDDGLNEFQEGTFSGIVNQLLPVSLLNFSAQIQNSETILTWSTASEINNNYFTIERSADGL
jgi:hypothetical protein